jgi:flavin-dependent dehydrogenase
MLWDLAVVGGGPCGSSAAMAAHAAGARVIAIAPPPRAGALAELIPALVEDALDRSGFAGAGCLAPHPRVSGAWTSWGHGEAELAPAILDPLGGAVLLDRSRFDTELRRELEAAGVAFRVDRVQGLARDGAAFTLALRSGERCRARRVVLATGRALPRFLVDNEVMGLDRLVAVALLWPAISDAGGPFRLAACAGGWWYAMPSGDRRLAVYLTDADLLERSWRTAIPRALPYALVPIEERARLAEGSLSAYSASTRARSCPSGAGWALAGDARIALDPLSGAGVLRALVDGARVARYLLADPDAEARRAFRRSHAEEFAELAHERARQYAAVRFEHPFWWRRRGTGGLRRLDPSALLVASG